MGNKELLIFMVAGSKCVDTYRPNFNLTRQNRMSEDLYRLYMYDYQNGQHFAINCCGI